MPPRARLASSLLLVAGLACVFAGLSAALGFTAGGMIASAAAIVALLYAGAVWFGESGRTDEAVVFGRDLIVSAGPLSGRSVVELFPSAMRGEIAAHCREALDGCAAQFTCAGDPAARAFEVAPIRTPEGAIVYAVLLSGALVRSRAVVLA